ncbi:MAG: DUF115 domain-containing protein [bacterium]|nr:DUF115 domain-containing protein [bacterium]
MGAQNLLKTNLEFFSIADPILRKQLSGDPPDRHQVIRTVTGEPKVLIKMPDGSTKQLYETGNPANDARRYVTRIPRDSVEAVIILGIGLGYHVEALAKHLPPGATFILLEEDEDLFRVALRHVDFKRLLSPRPWSLLVGEQLKYLVPVLVNLFESGTEAITCCVPPPFNSLCRFSRVLPSRLKKAGTIVEFNRRTRARLRRRWTENCLINLSRLPASRSLKPLEGRFKNLPASIICAGPSLDINLSRLARLTEKTVTICTDSALPVLHTLGITPHFIVSIDPFAPAPACLSSEPNPAARHGLICPMTANPELIANAGPDPYFTHAQDVELWTPVKRLCRPLPKVPVSGSVSLYAFEVARFLGLRPILFVGQDLSFPDFKAYSRGTRQALKQLVRADRFHSLERLNLENVLGRNPVLQPTPTGDTVPTTRTLLQYRFALKNICSTDPDRCLNCTGGGILDGQRADLQAVLDSFGSERPAIGDRLPTHEPPLAGDTLEKVTFRIRTELDVLLKEAAAQPEGSSSTLPPVLAHFGDLVHDVMKETGSLSRAITETARLIVRALTVSS